MNRSPDSSVKGNMSEGQKDYKSHVKDLINNLSSWRDESHRQMSNILSYHTKSIDKGLNDIVQEVTDLQTQVAVLRNERKTLLETVNSLNSEIRQLSAKSPSAEPKTSELDSSLMDTIDIKEECIEPPRIQNEIDEEKCIDYGSISDQSVPKLNLEHPRLDQWNSNASIINEFDYEGEHIGEGTCQTQNKGVISNLGEEVTEEKHPKMDRKIILNSPEGTIYSSELVCKECKFTFSTNEHFRSHLKNAHSKLDKVKVSKNNHESHERSSEQSNHSSKEEGVVFENSTIPMHKKIPNKTNIFEGNKKLKCDQCPYETSINKALRRHVTDVHTKKRHACKECGYTTPRMNVLKRHWDAIHNKGEKKFICGKCPYSSAEKYRLKNHMVAAHNMDDKEYKCEKIGRNGRKEVYVYM